MSVLKSWSLPEQMGPWHTPFAVVLPNGWPLEFVSVALLVTLCGVARFVYTSWIMGPIADYLQRNNLLVPGKRPRLLESSFKAIHYFFTTAWGLYLLLPSSWLWDTSDYWLNLPHAMSPIFYYYYIYQGSFYIFSLYSGLFLDVRRHDWHWLIVHHVVTVSLILYAWYWGMVRIGSVVLLLMDFNDGFLEGAKSFNYVIGRFSYVTSALFFFILQVSWPITRIILYYTHVLKPLYKDAIPMVDAQGITYHVYEWYAFFFMLCLIGALNIYWFVLILQTTFNLFFRNTAGDPREEAEFSINTEKKKAKIAQRKQKAN